MIFIEQYERLANEDRACTKADELEATTVASSVNRNEEHK